MEGHYTRLDYATHAAPDVMMTPVKIGRFAIIRELGRGGMGVAYLAYDEQLDRQVAVKLVQARSAGDVAAQERLRREAQAMARLTHPNIVTVHEVGTHNAQLYVAMEFVHGQTLSAWLRAKSRHWRDVVEVFQQAGAGLLAAHEAGLVHRDFKPDNVMVGDDGRVRVLDFGVARAVSVPEDNRDRDAAHATPHRTACMQPLNAQLTKTGWVWGTPGYVAPEQWLHDLVDARADQFAFCVSLYQGLYGERPFSGKTWKQVKLSVLHGTIQPAPPATQVPNWLRAVVVRGLQLCPSDRWPSMAALLDALGRDPGRQWRKWRGFVTAALALVAIVGAVVKVSQEGASAQVCSGAEEQLAEVWSPHQHAAVEQALLATQVSYAPDTWTRLSQLLDNYADEWITAHTEACEATAIRREQSQDILDVRMACLDDRRRALAALVAVLRAADANVVPEVLSAVMQLPRIDSCADPRFLAARVKPPEDPAVAASVEVLRTELARAQEIFKLGASAKALAIVRSLAHTGQELDYRPVQAEIDLLLGTIQDGRGDYHEAQQALERAYFAARETHHDTISIQAAIMLIRIVSLLEMAHLEDAQVWVRQAQAEMVQADIHEYKAEFLARLGMLLHRQGDYRQAADYLHRAVTLGKETLGSDHPDIVMYFNNLAIVLYEQGKYDEAVQYYRRALAVIEQSMGTIHPRAARLLNNLGGLLLQRGLHDDATAYLRRAVAIYEQVSGAGHPELGLSYNNLGEALLAQKQYNEATAYFYRTLNILETSLNPNHPYVAQPLGNLSKVRLRQHEYIEAEKLARRALDILEHSLSAEHPLIAQCHDQLAQTLAVQGQLSAAESHYRRALVIRESKLAADHLDTAESLLHLGEVLVSRGEIHEAGGYLRRALAIQEAMLGSEHPRVVRCLAGLAEVALAEGRVDDAIVHAARALAVGETHDIEPRHDAKVRALLIRAQAAE